MKLLIWGAGLVLAVLVGAAIFMRVLGHDPDLWHVDPTTAERTGQPNDYLIGPSGVTASAPDAPGPVADLPTRELLFLFDAIARNASRVLVVAGSVEEGRVTYVQHSLVMGFPDYITAQSVDLGDGRSSLVIWSRARFGYSDMGVNKARIEDWLGKMGTSG